MRSNNQSGAIKRTHKDKNTHTQATTSNHVYKQRATTIVTCAAHSCSINTIGF